MGRVKDLGVRLGEVGKDLGCELGRGGTWMRWSLQELG